MKNSVARAIIALDKLQVELAEDTPYVIPSTKEIRKRILKVLDLLENEIQD